MTGTRREAKTRGRPRLENDPATARSIVRILATENKREWIRAAYDAGLREIEVGSYVPARLMPQLADTAELVAFSKMLPGLVTSVLVPNLKGVEHAIDTQADLMLLPLSASRAHSLEGVMNCIRGRAAPGTG
jgi:hydroxymethylglutaryl-CoA lyase